MSFVSWLSYFIRMNVETNNLESLRKRNVVWYIVKLGISNTRGEPVPLRVVADRALALLLLIQLSVVPSNILNTNHTVNVYYVWFNFNFEEHWKVTSIANQNVDLSSTFYRKSLLWSVCFWCTQILSEL